MKIVLTNDDGYNAPGISALKDKLSAMGYETVVIAPDRDNSAISHSITLGKNIAIEPAGKGVYKIAGTPADCVMLSKKAGLLEDAALVISGINRGGNMGEDVHYSGTVAAAMEAGFCGFKSMALSVNSKKPVHYGAVFPFLGALIEETLRIKGQYILNANYPDIPVLKGLEWTYLGKREYIDHVEIEKKPDGTLNVLNRPSENIPSLLKGSDYYALSKGKISVTPLKLDWTDNALLRRKRK